MSYKLLSHIIFATVAFSHCPMLRALSRSKSTARRMKSTTT